MLSSSRFLLPCRQHRSFPELLHYTVQGLGQDSAGPGSLASPGPDSECRCPSTHRRACPLTALPLSLSGSPSPTQSSNIAAALTVCTSCSTVALENLTHIRPVSEHAVVLTTHKSTFSAWISLLCSALGVFSSCLDCWDSPLTSFHSCLALLYFMLQPQ